MKNLLLFCAVICLGIPLPGVFAFAGQGVRADDADPAVTLQAPFIHPGDMDMPTAKAMGLTYWADVDDQPLSSLAKPHRGGDQVAEWLVSSVSEVLDTNEEKYSDHLQQLEEIMDKTAVASYNRFMQESRIYSRMSMGKYHIHAFVEEKPFLLNKGVIEGRYRWLYDVPATITFIKEDVKDYQDSSDTSNFRLLVRMQVGRIQDAETAEKEKTADENESGEGLKIETWEVLQNKEVALKKR